MIDLAEDDFQNAGGTIGLMDKITALAWAMTPSSVMGPPVTTSALAPAPAHAPAPAAATTKETMAEKAHAIEKARAAVTTAEKNELQEQGAPDLFTLAVTSVGCMLMRKAAEEDCVGTGYGKPPMGAVVFKGLAKMSAMMAFKSLDWKIDEAKKTGDVTPLARHFEKLTVSFVEDRTDTYYVGQAAFLVQFWKEVSEMDPTRPSLPAFFLELYFEYAQGKGLPREWPHRMMFDAQKAHDAASVLKGGDLRAGGITAPPAPAQRSVGGAAQAGYGW